jgi:hypothetical protein
VVAAACAGYNGGGWRPRLVGQGHGG